MRYLRFLPAVFLFLLRELRKKYVLELTYSPTSINNEKQLTTQGVKSFQQRTRSRGRTTVVPPKEAQTLERWMDGVRCT